MAAIDYEAEYNNRKRVPEHPAIFTRWQAASKLARDTATCELDLAYGDEERQRYDFFPTHDPKAPLAVFIHGGYWQGLDRRDFSFVAPVLTAKGISVAIPSYSLCPAVTVMEIVAEMRHFMAVLWAETKQGPLLVGHSAGGHLAAAMLAADWSRVDGVPPDLVRAAYALSGVFDLPPLVATTINGALKLDDAKARAASPLHWAPPPKDRILVAAAGGLESAEFLRQSLDIADQWSRSGVKAECVVVPGTNHFTIVDELAKPESAMVARCAGLARAVAVPRYA
jgi:arylformamidase